jgi:hypothetical protein
MKFHPFLLTAFALYAGQGPVDAFLPGRCLSSAPCLTHSLGSPFGLRVSEIEDLPTGNSLNDASPSLSPNLVDERVEAFTAAWQHALRGDASALQQALAANASWSSPQVSSFKEQLEALESFSSFFQEPSLVVFSAQSLPGEQERFQLEYQLSFWYPTFWRPRLIVPGSATVSLDSNGLVVAVEEKWEVSISDLALKQFPPRAWDVWHLMSSPMPEYPPLRALGSDGKVEYVELPATMMQEASFAAPLNNPGPPLLTVPEFALSGTFRTSRPNRDPYYTTLPVESFSGRFVDSKSGREMKYSTWRLPVPSNVQPLLMAKARESKVEELAPSYVEPAPGTVFAGAGEQADDVLAREIDYETERSGNKENLDLMASVTGGAMRGDFDVSPAQIAQIAARECRSRRLRLLPPRVVAMVALKGQPEARCV